MPGRLTGLMETQAAINQRIRAVGAAGRREVVDFGLALMGAGALGAPVDQGDLRGGFIIEVNGERWAHTESGPDGSVIVVQDRQDVPSEADHIVVYVGTSGIPYAVKQHEEMTWRHPKGGHAKYLELEVNRLGPKFLDNLEAAIKRAARGE